MKGKLHRQKRYFCLYNSSDVLEYSIKCVTKNSKLMWKMMFQLCDTHMCPFSYCSEKANQKSYPEIHTIQGLFKCVLMNKPKMAGFTEYIWQKTKHIVALHAQTAHKMAEQQYFRKLYLKIFSRRLETAINRITAKNSSS